MYAAELRHAPKLECVTLNGELISKTNNKHFVKKLSSKNVVKRNKF